MTAAIPDWTRAFVTATTETDQRETVTQFTNWRAVLYPAGPYGAATGEVDLTIYADDALHGPDQCGTSCHDEGSAANLCLMSVPDGSERERIDAATTAVAEQGFRVDGPWVLDDAGRLVAPLMPVILDPTCAAYEPDVAAQMPDDPQHQPYWGGLLSAEKAQIKAAWLNARGADVCPVCLGFRKGGVCLNCTMIAERAVA